MRIGMQPIPQKSIRHRFQILFATTPIIEELRPVSRISTILLFLSLVPPHVAWSIEQEAVETSQKLIVGTKHSPPFAFKNSDGQWTGISIELWRHLTDVLNLEYELREMTLSEMLSGLETGELDAAVSAISVTADRHQRVDFCHPHFTTGLGIAVSATRQASYWSQVHRIVSNRLLAIVGVMIAIILVCGLLFWRFERNVNENLFGGRRRRGIGMGMWWSMTLLLGNKGVVPVNTWSRVVAGFSMFGSILLVSLLTGIIASVLTVQHLEVGITDVDDLRNVRVVTVESSTSAEYLSRRRVTYRTRASAEEALRAVVDNEADAAVYDEALLKYLTLTEFSDKLQVLPVSFNTQEYAIALKPETPLRKPINEALLRFRASDNWDDLIFRYLGD